MFFYSPYNIVVFLKDLSNFFTEFFSIVWKKIWLRLNSEISLLISHTNTGRYISLLLCFISLIYCISLYIGYTYFYRIMVCVCVCVCIIVLYAELNSPHWVTKVIFLLEFNTHTHTHTHIHTYTHIPPTPSGRFYYPHHLTPAGWWGVGACAS